MFNHFLRLYRHIKLWEKRYATVQHVHELGIVDIHRIKLYLKSAASFFDEKKDLNRHPWRIIVQTNVIDQSERLSLYYIFPNGGEMR